MQRKQFRSFLRSLHVLAGVLLAVYLYSPLREIALYTLLLQWLVVPMVGVSGLALWQQSRLNALLKRRMI